jgi:hypothetical protein
VSTAGPSNLNGESGDQAFLTRPPLRDVPHLSHSDIDLFVLRFQILGLLAKITVERGDLEVALDLAHRALHTAREAYATDPDQLDRLSSCLEAAANILELLGRLDEALALDAEWKALNPDKAFQVPEVFLRSATKHIAAGEVAEAETFLRLLVGDISYGFQELPTTELPSSKWVEASLRPNIVLAELLERRGTAEARVEARTLRDQVARHLAVDAERRAAALEETRAAAAEAVRQWREERIKAREKKKGGGKGKGKKSGKGKKKGRRGKAKGASSAAAIEGEPPHEAAGGEQAEGAAAVEGAAAAEAKQQPGSRGGATAAK